MKLKRLAAGITAAVMAFTVVGTSLGDILPEVKANVATVAGAEKYGDYTYRLRTDSELTDTIEIIGYSGDNSELKIIDNINGNPVTRLADNAFKNCKNLTKVVVPDSVVNMGDHVFYGCVNLDEIIIPDDMNYIGKYSFDDTKILNNQSGTLKYIGNWVVDCENVEEVSIRNGTRGIAGRAFEYCTKLKNIIIPEGVVRISVDAFYYCSNLTSIILPDSLKYISWYAFGWCTNLESITIPSGVTWIGDDAFAYCRKLKSISIPQGVSQISHWIFYDCTNLESITIYDGIEFIGIYAFYDCTKLKEIAIPSSVKSIQKYAFAYCRSLQNVVLPRSVTSLGEKAFLNCSSLETITIPDSVTEISSSAFDGCSSKLTIKGAKGSLAEKFAKQQGFKFEEVKFIHGRADEKLNSVYITWSDVEINELQYPIYNEDEFAKQLKYWVEVDKKEYFVSLQPFLEKYTYKDILSLHVNIPVMTENGEAYSVKGESTVADLMAYILFADSVQDYIEQTLNEVRNRISNSKPYYAFFLDKIKNFNSQYLYFQQRLEGKDAFNDTLQSLLLAKTAMSIIDGLKVTYKSGETKYITFGNSGQTAEDFIKIYKEDIVSTVPLKTYSYFTDLYKATVSESPKYYDELKYYILSGGDTSYLNSYYKDTLKGYSLQIKNVKELFKIAKDTGSLPSETGSLIGLGLDNLSYWADKYNTEHSSEIKLAKEVWSWSNKAKDIIGAVSKGSLVGAFSSAYDITQSYIDEVKKVYQNASNTEAGWYAITYCYLQDNNPKLLEAIIDSETGNAEISIDRLIRYGFPVHSDDIIEKDIAKYYEKHSSLNYTFTPDEEFRFYLWNACNNINTIQNIDCNEYREMLFQYILAELNLESGVTGVQYVADITANDSTLGSVSGTGVYSTKETITLSAIPYENVSFSGWKNILTGEIESKGRNYSINLNDNIKYEAQFAPAEVDAAEQPIISQQPLSRNYRLGDTPVSLTITASNNDSGSLSVKWYKNSSDKNYGGIYISEGFSVIPNLSEVGTYYYYAIVTNTLCSKVGVKTVTTQSSKCTDTAKIVISEPVLSGIEIDSLPNKTEYDKYEYFDNTGMTVKLVYSNGNKVIFNDYCISGFDNSLVGDNVITISAYGYSAKLTLHIKEHIHNYNLWQTTVKPTCTEGGGMIRSCSVCGAEETKTIDALGHDYSEQWTVDEEADCVNDGSKSRHCSRCDAKTDVTVIEAKGHTEVVDKAVAVTCTADGYTEGKHCSVCNVVIKAQTVVPAKGHTEVVDKAVAATCTKTGLTEGKHCSVCDAVIKAQEVVPAHGHTEVIDKAVEATCTKTGLTEGKHCSVCDTVIKAQEVVPAKGHTEVVDKAVEATCTKTGLTEGKHCSVCNTVIKAQEVVPATGKHSFGNWKITKAATCTAEGTQTRTCSVCGKVETATIAKIAHKYVNTVVKPTYTAQGYTLHKCSVCGASYKDTYTAKLTLAKVTGVKLGGRAADALRVNWSKNANADGYIVEMYQGGKWVRVAKITNNSTTTFRKAGLSASTVYKFRVRAYKMSGKTAVYGAYSTELAARTNPSVMTGAKLSGRAADALRINWSKNASADGYIVEMYQGNKWLRVAKITNNNTTTFRKAGLKASSVYKFRVRAYKMSGKTALYGNYSATVTARTNPSAVTGVKIGGTAKDALRVNWTKNASAQGYIVEMYQGGKWVRVAKITNGNTTTFRKAGLKKSTTYKFRVCAYYMSGKTALYGGYGSVSGKTTAK